MAIGNSRTDTKPRVAVYGIVRNEGERAIHDALVASCAGDGNEAIGYIDADFPRQGRGSAWDRLVADIANRQFYGVVMRWHVKGFADYCYQYDTRLVVVKGDG